MKKILITGGTGFIGSHLSEYLREKGFNYSILTRGKSNPPYSYSWDVDKKEIDENAFNDTEIIIHLAGAGIGDHRWTEEYKREILKSRTDSAALIFDTLKKINHSVKLFISASAIGYYGNTGETPVNESSPNGKDFLAAVCAKWEESAKNFESTGMRVVIFRQGHVLGPDGGVLPVLAKPVKYFLGAPLGSGKQYLSWIHIDDLCRLYYSAITDTDMKGIFNAVSPVPVKNKKFTKLLARALNKPFWPLNVPSSVLKMILGEQAFIVLSGQKVEGTKSGLIYERTDLKNIFEEFNSAQ